MLDTELSRLSERYLAALRTHFDQDPRASLLAAHELGVQAVAMGLETLSFAKIHDQALQSVFSPACSPEQREIRTAAAAHFFTEAMRPIENTHRAALQTGVRLYRVSKTLKQRTKDVADSQRELLQQITERKTAETALELRAQASNQLLTESRVLQKHLQSNARQVLSADEKVRKEMSLQLHDEIAQALLGINVRLHALKKEATASNGLLSKEIATTQRLVAATVKTINRFAREFGSAHEK